MLRPYSLRPLRSFDVAQDRPLCSSIFLIRIRPSFFACTTMLENSLRPRKFCPLCPSWTMGAYYTHHARYEVFEEPIFVFANFAFFAAKSSYLNSLALSFSPVVGGGKTFFCDLCALCG
jgi:hypothetical protein